MKPRVRIILIFMITIHCLFDKRKQNRIVLFNILKKQLINIKINSQIDRLIHKCLIRHLEAVLKTHLELKSFVGTKCSILKILCVFLRLNTWSRLDFKPEMGF
jgi:hypothetical protein